VLLLLLLLLPAVVAVDEERRFRDADRSFDLGESKREFRRSMLDAVVVALVMLRGEGLTSEMLLLLLLLVGEGERGARGERYSLAAACASGIAIISDAMACLLCLFEEGKTMLLLLMMMIVKQ
jgi:hypothetical protein